jgi:hypothetical protein
MLTCFAREFLGGEIAPATALRTVRVRDDGALLARPLAVVCNREPVPLVPTRRFACSNCRTRPHVTSFSVPGVDALKTRRESGPAVSKRALLAWGRSMRPAAPICAFDRTLGNAPEWARAAGF